MKMDKRRTYDPGECWQIIENAGFDSHVCGSYFLITINGRYAPGALGVSIPRSGRVPISELATEMKRAEAYRHSLAA
jgi:hypothetical protein